MRGPHRFSRSRVDCQSRRVAGRRREIRERQRPRAVVRARGLTGRAPGRLRSVALYDGDTQPPTRQKEAFSPERSAGPFALHLAGPGRSWSVLGGVDAQRVMAAAGGACGGGRRPRTQGLPGTPGPEPESPVGESGPAPPVLLSRWLLLLRSFPLLRPVSRPDCGRGRLPRLPQLPVRGR